MVAMLDDVEARGERDDIDDVAAYGVVVFGPKARKWAISLTWRSVDDSSSWSASQARAIARELKRDRYVLVGLSAGFGSSRMGHRIGMPCLAAAIWSAIQSSFLGVWVIPEVGWYLLAMRDERVVPTTDRLFENEQEARVAFNDLFVKYMWPVKYAPESWGVASARSDDLEYVLQDEGRSLGRGVPKLQDATMRSAVAIGLGIGVMGAAGLIAFWHVTNMTDVALSGIAALDQQRQQLFAEQEMKRQRARNQTWPAMPWHGKAFGLHAMEWCERAVQKVPLTGPGWSASSVSCSVVAPDTMSVSVSYSRTLDTSPVSWLEWWLVNSDGASFGPEGAVRGEGRILPTITVAWENSQGAQFPRSAQVAWSVPLQGALPVHQPNFPSAKVAGERSRLLRVADDYGRTGLTMSIADGPPQSYLNVDGDPVQGPLWRVLTVEANFAGDRPFSSFFAWAMRETPAMILDAMTWTPSTNAWSVRVFVHERLAVPGFPLPGIPAASNGPPSPSGSGASS